MRAACRTNVRCGRGRRRRAVALGAALIVSVLPRGAAAGPAAPPAASSGGGFSVPAPARTTLKNGLTVLVLERRAIPLVQFRLLVRAGAAADPAGKEGTASLMARLLKRGTRTRSAQQFSEEVEFVGGSLESFAGAEATVVAGEFAGRDLEVGFNLLADMVLSPAFRQEEFDKEKRLVLADIVSRLDDPERVAQEAFGSWLFGAHPYGRPAQGTRRSVEAIAGSDVKAFHEARFAPNNSVLAIVGDIDAAQAAQRVERYFAAWKRRATPEVRVPDPAPARGRKVLLVDKPDATQSQIRFGNVGIRRGDPGYFPLVVANTILGGGFTSLLVEEVRVKKGLTYSIRSRVEALRSPGSVSVATFSKNETVLETIRLSLDQIRRVREGTIPADSLDKARNYLAGLYPLRIESPDDLAAEILNVEFYGLGADYINQYQKRVRGVGVEAMKRSAARFLPLDDLAVVVVGPAASLKKDLETVGPVTVRSIASVLDPS
ncbi:MAG: insulinase family protein [Acidobacteria bacterium]|nr:insulinase family protein [Acidobacteriota bacterium]